MTHFERTMALVEVQGADAEGAPARHGSGRGNSAS